MKHTLVAAIPRMVAGRNLAVGSHMAGILNSIAGAFRPQQIKRARGRSSENPGWASQVEQDRGNDKLDDWQQQRQFQLAQSWAPDSSDLGRRLRPKQRSRLPPGISARKGECHHRCKCIPVRTVPETREQSAPGKQEGQHPKIGQREKGPGEPALHGVRRSRALSCPSQPLKRRTTRKANLHWYLRSDTCVAVPVGPVLWEPLPLGLRPAAASRMRRASGGACSPGKAPRLMRQWL